MRYYSKVDVKQLHATPKAYLFEIGGVEIWIPKSLCKNYDGYSAYIYTKVLKDNLKKATGDHADLQLGIRLDLNQQQLKDMITLCHPDKHMNSNIATKITSMLLDKKK